MRTLYLRIWFTVVAALALFALVSGWLIQNHLEQERARFDAVLSERMASWGEMIEHSLPSAQADAQEQAEALREWARKLRVSLALDDAKGQRIGASEDYPRQLIGGAGRHAPTAIRLNDGRTLWLSRPWRGRVGPNFDPGPPPGFFDANHNAGPIPDGPPLPRRWPFFPRDWPASLGLVALLALLFLAVAVGAYPVVRRLTRRLEKLKQGVEAFGAGALEQRVHIEGRDEVAMLASSFNQAAQRIETLVRSNQSLLANASHELRSPLARLKMAVAMWGDAPPAMQASLHHEIDTNIRELDALVDEVLLSSRLEAGAAMHMEDLVDLLGLAAEEASRVQAQVQGEPLVVLGSDRLLRRALRNLLENARRYAGEAIEVYVATSASGQVLLQVCDRGPGVPEAERERIFEPFYRMSGHAEREGGVGLGLALVRQIAQRHGGNAHCEPREGGGSCFVISLPARLLHRP